MRLTDGAFLAEGLSCRYGDDAWTFTRARLPVEGIRQQIQVTDIAAEAHFSPPGPQYPGKLGNVLRELGPSGPYALEGMFAVDRTGEKPRGSWDVLVRSEQGAMALTSRRRIPLENIRGQARVRRENIEIAQLTGDTFGGELAASGTIDPRRPLSYGGQLQLQGADMARVASLFPKAAEESELKLSGRLDVQAQVSGDHSSLAALRGRGEARVSQGELWQMPVLRSVVNEVRIAPMP